MTEAPAVPAATPATPTTSVFGSIPAKPDHPAIERAILELWERHGTFGRLQRQIAGGPVFSFVDGPITANNKMGVHHAWGRTLKDLYQRWYAMRGFDQRFQNGFDCQGLWVEVEVEKSLGLNSKKEIEELGLDVFSRACRDRVAEFSEVQTEQSKRLGQWMDWDNDYYTLSDTNMSYIWQFLKKCQERDWLYVGHRAMTWCPRCGTSLSQHELIDSYKDVTHQSLYVRFPLVDAPGEALVAWTTTPWTLPANVAAAVRGSATYALVQQPGGDVWVAEARVEALFGEDAVVLKTAPGTDLVGRTYSGPFADLPAAEGAPFRVLEWGENVSLEDGTGVVHIAPGCGADDYELGKAEGIDPIVPVDDAGAFYDSFGFLAGITTHDAAGAVIEDLKERGVLLRVQPITHRYPTCWRCSTELIFRLVDEWFISADEIREQMREANRGVEWVPAFYGKRMDDWLVNMGDWCISRKRYWGLALPFYRDPESDDPNDIFVVETKEQLRELAVDQDLFDAMPQMHRPWIDEVKIRHPETGKVLERVTEVGDCWLDAGIVPFSTMGWQNPERIESGYATGASQGLSTADLPSHEEWERWYPAEAVIEMREQIRLWFYSMLFMGVVLDGRAPYKRVLAYEKVQDQDGKPMHKSWGNAIWFDDAAEEMGADVMRWMYASQTPSQDLKFGPAPAGEVRRRLLTLWNVTTFFTTYASLDGWSPAAHLDVDAVGDAGIGLSLLQPAGLDNPLDAWLAARTHQLVAEVDGALERWDTPASTRAVDRFVDDLSNWYVRRSRRRFWKGEGGADDTQAAYETLWGALVTLARVLAPSMPFLAEELWQHLVVAPALGGADVAGGADLSQLDDRVASVHLSGWPVADTEAAAHPLLEEVAAVQRVVGLGRAARAGAKRKLRQPLRELVVLRRSTRGEGASALESLLAAHGDEIEAELSVKVVTAVDGPDGRWVEGLMPLLPKLGPKYGKQVADIRRAIAAGDVTIGDDRRARVGEFVLETDEYEHRSSAADGWAVAEDHEWVVAVTTELDDELVLEGLAREVVRLLQVARKDAGLEVSDRIAVQWHASGRVGEALAAHGASIADEVLATSFDRADAVPPGATSSTVEDEEVALAISKA